MLSCSFVFGLAGCGKAIKDQISGTGELPEGFPALCTPGVIYNEFPMDLIYPGSVTVSSMEIGFEDEISGMGNDGIMGTFCAKATEAEIVAWYDEKLSDYTSDQMEDVGSMSYYYQKGDAMVMVDVIQQDLDGHKMFSVDARAYYY